MKPCYTNQQIAVLGLGSSGEAAALRLLEEGARVTVLDSGDSEKIHAAAATLRAAGARVLLGGEAASDATIYDLGVLSPGIDPAVPLVRDFCARSIPMIGELEDEHECGQPKRRIDQNHERGTDRDDSDEDGHGTVPSR